MKTLRVKVRDLQPGDFMPATQRTVVSSTIGSRTPRGRRDVIVRDRNQVMTIAGQWNADTMIDIEREGERKS